MTHSKCLRKAEVYLSLVQAEECRRSRSLRYDERRRIQEVTVVNRELSANGRFEPYSDPDGVRPQSTEIAAKRFRFRARRTLEDVACPSEYISAIIERNHADRT